MPRPNHFIHPFKVRTLRTLLALIVSCHRHRIIPPQVRFVRKESNFMFAVVVHAQTQFFFYEWINKKSFTFIPFIRKGAKLVLMPNGLVKVLMKYFQLVQQRMHNIMQWTVNGNSFLNFTVILIHVNYCTGMLSKTQPGYEPIN